MKSNMEFGILPKDYAQHQQQHQQQAHRKGAAQSTASSPPQRELILNNQERVTGPLECISAGAFPGHICFADIHENVVQKTFTSTAPATVDLCPPALELRHKETSRIMTTVGHAPQSAIAVTKPNRMRPPTQLIALTDAPTRIDANNPPAGVFTRRRKEAARRKWLT